MLRWATSPVAGASPWLVIVVRNVKWCPSFVSTVVRSTETVGLGAAVASGVASSGTSAIVAQSRATHSSGCTSMEAGEASPCSERERAEDDGADRRGEKPGSVGCPRGRDDDLADVVLACGHGVEA